MIDISHVIEWLSIDGEGGVDADTPFTPAERFTQAEKAYLSLIKSAKPNYDDLECTGIGYAAAETFGFDKGFRAGVKMALDLLAIGRSESVKST